MYSADGYIIIMFNRTQCRISHVARVANATGLRGASEGPQEIEKMSGHWISKDVVHGAMHAKIDYELDKPIFEPLQSDDCIELRMYKLITAANLSNLPARFPNIEIALRIYLCLMVTNCRGKRSFSKLKRIENDLRLTMRQDRLNRLTLMSLEH